MRIAVVINVVSPHDVRVVKLGRGAGFDAEPFEIGGVVDAILREHLDGALHSHENVLGQVDLAHAPFAEMPQQLVLAEFESLVFAGKQLVRLPIGNQLRLDKCCGQRFLPFGELAVVGLSILGEKFFESIFFDQLASPDEIQKALGYCF